jgi:late competence protein required for DNA uptake (superfamily II DNA/RNA helicase)
MKICPGFEEIDLPNKIYCPKCESDANTDIRLIFVEGIQEPQWQVYCRKCLKAGKTANDYKKAIVLWSEEIKSTTQ